LRSRGVQVVGPEEGPLAEGESGPGRLSEPEAIVAALVLRQAQDEREGER
jgi:phosphopantothenoylcysteine decarboxylase/phosphopantothenate--cysteine ligase